MSYSEKFLCTATDTLTSCLPAQQIFTDMQWLNVRTERCCNCVGNVLQNGRMVNNSESKSVSLLLYLQTVCSIHTAQNVISVAQEGTEIWRRDRHNLV